MITHTCHALIVNLAPTGAVADAGKNTAVPLSADAILADVRACVRLGVAMVHLHTRDESGLPSCDPKRFQSLIERIRATPEGRDLVLCVTTSGRHGQTLEQRAAVLELEGPAKPDMASLTLGSLNFPTGTSVNTPDTIRFLARRMLELGIKPELEVFDLGMIHFAKILIRQGLIRPPFYFNLLLGNMAGAQASLNDVAALVNNLPSESIWSLAGIGRSQKPAMGLGCVMASGVRIGLEDNLWLDPEKRIPATNPSLVSWVSDLAHTYGRSLASAADARSMLSLN